MKSKIFPFRFGNLWILGMVLVLTISFSAIAGDLIRNGRGFRMEKTHEIKAPKDGKLELDEITGDVTVDSWDKNLVRIIEKVYIDVYTEEEAGNAVDEFVLRIDKRGKVISAIGPGRYRGYVDIDYRVTLPRDFSGEMSTSGGDFDVRELRGEYYFSTSGGDITIVDCEDKIRCKTSGGDLELDNIKGILIATTSGGDITCENCGDDLELKTSGGDLDLRRITGGLCAKTSGGDIELYGLKGTCSVKTSGGDIVIRDVESERLIEAGTSGGDIEVEQVKGDVDVGTSGGDITVENVSGELEASTSGGDIDVYKVSKDLLVTTSGGDIEVKGAEGCVEARTSGGDIEVDILEYNSKVDQNIELKSSGGSLELVLPKNFKGTVDAVIYIRNARWDEYNIYSDFPLKVVHEDGYSDKKSWHRRVEGTIVATGEINGGGNRIKLETSNGDINIRKR